MSNFSEENTFPDTVRKVNLDIGNYEANKSINETLQALVNRTRFLKENTNTGGSGFSYGGEWNAESIITTQDVSAFDNLNNCTYIETTLTAISANISAFVNNISSIDSGTTRNFRFTWPDTSSSAFFVGFTKTTLTDMQQITADENSSIVALGSFMGNTVLLTKQVGQSLVQEPYIAMSIDIGDEVSLSYRAATQTLYFYNETQNHTLIAQFSLQSYFASRPSLLVGCMNLSSLECTFDDMGDYPLQQDNISFEFPDDLTKTYLVANSTQDSVINNKRINTNDFVNFITDGGDVVDIMISRLVTDSYIQTIVTGMLNQPSITSLEMINPIGDGVTIVTLENANEINIVINGEYDPAPQFNFNLHDNCFTQGRLVSLRLNALIAITFFSIEYSTYYGQPVILENITAETSWVFVFEKRGGNVELISKYQV